MFDNVFGGCTPGCTIVELGLELSKELDDGDGKDDAVFTRANRIIGTNIILLMCTFIYWITKQVIQFPLTFCFQFLELSKFKNAVTPKGRLLFPLLYYIDDRRNANM